MNRFRLFIFLILFFSFSYYADNYTLNLPHASWSCRHAGCWIAGHKDCGPCTDGGIAGKYCPGDGSKQQCPPNQHSCSENCGSNVKCNGGPGYPAQSICYTCPSGTQINGDQKSATISNMGSSSASPTTTLTVTKIPSETSSKSFSASSTASQTETHLLTPSAALSDTASLQQTLSRSESSSPLLAPAPFAPPAVRSELTVLEIIAIAAGGVAIVSIAAGILLKINSQSNPEGTPLNIQVE